MENKTKKMIYLSLLVATSLALSIVESFIPVVVAVPGAKLGLANIVTLTILVVYGLKEALVVNGLKSLLLMLSTGSVTGLFYSLPAGLLSAVIMYLVYRFFSKNRQVFSLIGVSIFGSIAHNFAQLTVAAFILSNKNIYIYLPIFLLISLFTGYFVGLASNFVSEQLKKIKLQ